MNKAFEKMSAIFSIKGMWLVVNSLERTLSLIKCKSNSTCFVLAWQSGFATNETILRLSHQIFDEWGREI